jgi:hypothetical protein
VTILVLPALAVVAGLLSELAGTGTPIARRLSVVVLVLQLAAAIAIPPEPPISVGGATLQLTPFAHLAIALTAVGALATTVLGLVVGLPPRWTAAVPLQVGLLAAAATTGDTRAALLFASAAAFLALVMGRLDRRDHPSPRALGEASPAPRATLVALRATLPAAVLLLAVAAFPASAARANPDNEPPLLLLGAGAGLALFSAAVPFHRWATGGRAPAPLVVPALLVWPPAILASIVLAWVAQDLPTISAPMEGGLLALLGIGGYLAAGLAALVHDDLRRVLVYLTLQDAGIVLLGLADGVRGWEAVRSWILVVVAAKVALALWAALLVAAAGSAESRDLGGWGRRLPLAAAGLAGAAVASVGLPGLIPWWARGQLADLAFPGGGGIAAAIALVAALPYLRWLVIGLAPVAPGLALADGLGWPSLRLAPPAPMGVRALFSRLGEFWLRLRRGWPAVRYSIASLVVLVGAVLALATATNLVGVQMAAAGAPPPSGPVAPPSPSPGPSFVPLPSP